jgi:hypothetical protein
MVDMYIRGGNMSTVVNPRRIDEKLAGLAR